jgi:hypothetical protein
METERIALSQRERDRLKVLHEVKQKQLTQVAAAARLKVTDRQVRRMLLRIGEHGDGALVHGLRGRPSNRKLAARLEQKILARLRQRYADFGPTLAGEHLAQEGFPREKATRNIRPDRAPMKSPLSLETKGRIEPFSRHRLRRIERREWPLGHGHGDYRASHGRPGVLSRASSTIAQIRRFASFRHVLTLFTVNASSRIMQSKPCLQLLAIPPA